MSGVTRRGALGVAAGAAVLLSVGRIPGALAAANDAKALIDKFAGGKAPQAGKVTLTVPEIAENGNTVPLTVAVDSPMTKDSYVEAVLIVADGNPNPGVATFRFSPMAGKAEAATRMRLAQTQNVIAVARMNDGAVFMEQKAVKVTIGGCGG